MNGIIKDYRHKAAAEKKASNPKKPKARTKHACDKCRSRKIKCQFVDKTTKKVIEVTDEDIKNGEVACKYCLKLRQVCTFEQSHKTRSRGKKKLMEELREKERLKQNNVLVYYSPENTSPGQGISPPTVPQTLPNISQNRTGISPNSNSIDLGLKTLPIPSNTQQEQSISTHQERTTQVYPESNLTISKLQEKIERLFEFTRSCSINDGRDPQTDGFNRGWYDGTMMNSSDGSVNTPGSFWAPSLPSESKLIPPTQEEIDKFHSIFFEEDIYVSEIIFKARYLNNLKLQDPYAMCLAYMIWASSSFSTEEYYHRSEGYYQEAKRRSTELISNDKLVPHSSSNMIELVQYFILCSDYDVKHGRTANSGMSIASAIRIAQMLGFDRIDDKSAFTTDNLLLDNRKIAKEHSESESATTTTPVSTTNHLSDVVDFDPTWIDDAFTFMYNINAIEEKNAKREAEQEREEYEEYLILEERRRTYWKVFCIDKYYTIGTGLPSAISNKNSIKSRLPYTTSLDLLHKNPLKTLESHDQPPFLVEALERVKRGEILYNMSPAGAQAMFLHYGEEVIIWCKDIHSPLHERENFTMEGINKVLSQYEQHFKDLQTLKNLFEPYTDERDINYTSVTFEIIHLTMLHAIIAIFTKMLKEYNGKLPQKEMNDIYLKFRLKCCILTAKSLKHLSDKNMRKLLVSDTFFFFTTHQVVKSSIQLIVNSNDSMNNRELSNFEKEAFDSLLECVFKFIDIIRSLKTRSNMITKLIMYYTKRLEKFYSKSYDTGFFNDMLGF